MECLDCNDKAITGYSVGCMGEGPVTFHGHRKGESNKFYTEFESYFGSKLHWMFFPIEEDEFITAISRWYGEVHQAQGLIVSALFLH